jgi:hypothetical protein
MLNLKDFLLQRDKYPPMHCRIHYSVFTLVLFVKLDLHKIVTTLKRIHEARKFQHTINVLALMAAPKMSTRWRSWRHIMPRSDLVCFATVLQDKHIMCGARITESVAA